MRSGRTRLHFMRAAMDTVEFLRKGPTNRTRLVKYLVQTSLGESAREALQLSRLVKVFEVYDNEVQALAS